MYPNMYPKYVECDVYSKHKSGIEKEVIVLSFRVMKYFMGGWYLNHIFIGEYEFATKTNEGRECSKVVTYNVCTL